MLKTILSKLKSKRAIFIICLLVVVIFFVFKGNSSTTDGEFKVKKTDFVRSVSVSGKVVAVSSVEMGFETSGTISSRYKAVGDKVVVGEQIVALDSSELQASRDKARADLLAEEAELLKLKSSGIDSTEVQNNKRLLVNSILDAYTKADDAIRNKADQFFDDGRSSGPEIKYTFNNYFSTKNIINDGRESVEKILTDWQSEIGSLNLNNYTSRNLDNAFSNLLAVKKFLDTVSFAVNSYEQSDILTLSMIEKYKGDVATARSNINDAVSSITNISDDFSTSLSDIPVQEARVEAARADVRSFDAQIAKTIIRSPINGIVSLNDAKSGESVSANTKLVSVVSADLEIEAYIPEVNINGITLQNKVTVDLDAAPGVVDFDAYVSHIDPAETERDGVSNYKIKVKPYKQDQNIKPGMTADIMIETERRSEVIVIPKKYVLVGTSKVVVQKNKKETEEREVVLGKDDGRGGVEVVSGLSEGETLILSTSTQ